MEICAKYCGCHQRADRSFFVGKYQFPLCARCTGIAIGHFVAICAAPFLTGDYWIAALALPMVADGSIQYVTSYESTNRRRMITGVLYGFAFTSVTIRIFREIVEKIRRIDIQ